MSDLVGNPEDRFSHNKAQKILALCSTQTQISLGKGQGVQCRMVLVVNFFVFLKLNVFCFVAAILNPVHDLEAIFHLP